MKLDWIHPSSHFFFLFVPSFYPAGLNVVIIVVPLLFREGGKDVVWATFYFGNFEERCDMTTKGKMWKDIDTFDRFLQR